MASLVPDVDTKQPEESYKSRWARYVARENLQTGFNLLKEKLVPFQPLNEDATLSQFIELQKQVVDLVPGKAPQEPGKFKIGIIGAGAAGLFQALIIDYLNENSHGKLDISYDILEAGDQDRLGGRLYTHHFSKGKHDYYDVGAMRFPDNQIMRRTFQLFEYIGLKSKEIPYYFGDQDKVCPNYYNDILIYGPPEGKDPFKVNVGVRPEDQIPDKFIEQNPGALADNTIKDFVETFQNILKGGSDQRGWELLMNADFMSTRQFFRTKGTIVGENGKPLVGVNGLVEGPGYNFNTTEWLETFNLGTGWYNQSLAETVLDTMDFSAPRFLCLEGGTQQVATAMAAKAKTKPEFNMEVTGIVSGMAKPTPDHINVQVQIKKFADSKNKKQFTRETRDYFTVFNTTTLGAMQRMDLTQANLRYGTKQAIRSLGYGASCKVGIKFRTGWWMKEPHNINKGGLGKTDLPLRVCVYPSYNLNDADGECVLLCSYTWAQDAQRLGSLISPQSPADEEELLDVLFHDLALIHEKKDKCWPYEKLHAHIKSQYITHHAFDWYCDQNMSGAFAYFGPGQFSQMWPEIIRPNGWLFITGEAASAHHAWIVGALESAVRGVYQMLSMLYCQNPTFPPYLEAMKLLAEGNDNLPFSPLPSEMPRRALNSDDGKYYEVDFTTAQVILSYLDQIVEHVQEETRKKFTGGGGPQQVVVSS